MDNIIEFNDFGEKEEINESLEDFFRIVGEIPGMTGIESLAMILQLNDEDFDHMAPLVLEEMRIAMNSPVDRYQMALEQTSSGMTHEQFQELIRAFIEKVETLEGIDKKRKDFVKEVFFEACNSIEAAQSHSGKIFQIPIELCDENAKIPTYGTDGASGADVFATEDCVIEPGQTKILPLGFKVQLPPGYEIQMRPRSGISSKTKLRIANAPGTIK